MQATQYADINDLLNQLLLEIKFILGEKLVGLYLYGSLVWGDFNHKTSDIDLVAALKSDVDDKELEQLRKMHRNFTNQHKEWDDRIEVQYMSLVALKTFKTKTNKIAVVSPGEPLHIKEVGKHYLINWYVVREKGLVLFGPDPKTIIDPISKEEFISSVKDHVKSWNVWVKGMRSLYAQSYAILTMCRALFAIRNGKQVSKKQAAQWVQKELPEWSELINQALEWSKDRGNKHMTGESTFPETEKFVNDIRNKI